MNKNSSKTKPSAKRSDNSSTTNNQFVTKAAVKQMLKANQSNLVKYIDTSAYSTGLTSGLSIQAISLPSTGTGESSMNGSAIDINSFDVRWNLIRPGQAPSATSGGKYMVRFTIVQAIGAANLSFADVYQDAANAIQAIVSPFRYDTKDRSFHVLYDKVMSVDNYNSLAFAESSKIPAKVHKARFDSVNSDWSTGQPYIYIATSEDNGIGTPASDLSLNTTVRAWFFDV
jgi:hypothetical protein